MLPDVVELLVVLRMKVVARRIAHEARAGAVAAVAGATIRDEEEHAVRVAMHQAGHGRVRVLAARIAHLPGRGVRLFDAWNDLAADGAILVRRIDEVEKIRRDGEGQLGVGEPGTGFFFGREGGEEFPQLFQRGDAVLELPAVVVPVRVGDVAPEAAPSGVELFQLSELLEVSTVFLSRP